MNPHLTEFEPRHSARWLRYVVALGIVGILVVSGVASSYFLPRDNAPPVDCSVEELHKHANELFQRSYSMKDAQQAWEQTAEAYRQITALNPDDAEAWFRLGLALHFSRNLDEAIVAHKRAATFGRGRGLALYNVACAYALKGETESAFDYLQQAVDAGFRSQQPIENDLDMASLLDDERFEPFALATRPANQLPERKQMDFWVGEWIVYSETTGKQIGTDVVTRGENGFLLKEKWTGVDQTTGESSNYYHPGSGKWIHQWVDASGSVSQMEGYARDGKMWFEGERYAADGTKRRVRMSFTPRPDRSILQTIEESEDGLNWTKSFDALYLPRRTTTMTQESMEDSVGCVMPPYADPPFTES